MTADQDKLIADLTEWADSRGNWLFVKWLLLYVDVLKKREKDDDGDS